MLHITDGKNQYILLNVHLPTSWASEAEFAGAIEETQRNAKNIAAETKCNYFITGGDWNVGVVDPRESRTARPDGARTEDLGVSGDHGQPAAAGRPAELGQEVDP